LVPHGHDMGLGTAEQARLLGVSRQSLHRLLTKRGASAG
jgi:hypothetical protein